MIFNIGTHSNPLENSDPMFLHKLSSILEFRAIPKQHLGIPKTAFDFHCAFGAWNCMIFEVTSNPILSVIP